ncbi:hypothetical protein [Lacrimispora sp.]|uniref:hypothetical protein n=2 Tax=Bacillota TaxID=1239 RepID=UPI0028AC3996|nr:hypothetical protein [Lacrimispora sp.]
MIFFKPAFGFNNRDAGFAYNKEKADAGAAVMGMKDKVTSKLLQATSDKTELNKKMLTWNKSFVEVNKTLGGNAQKNKNNK